MKLKQQDLENEGQRVEEGRDGARAEQLRKESSELGEKAAELLAKDLAMHETRKAEKVDLVGGRRRAKETPK